jgi:hypothetical protein
MTKQPIVHFHRAPISLTASSGSRAPWKITRIRLWTHRRRTIASALARTKANNRSLLRRPVPSDASTGPPIRFRRRAISLRDARGRIDVRFSGVKQTYCFALHMSAFAVLHCIRMLLAQSGTWAGALQMSAFGGKADLTRARFQYSKLQP